VAGLSNLSLVHLHASLESILIDEKKFFANSKLAFDAILVHYEQKSISEVLHVPHLHVAGSH
jgi:hypothetical protein